MRPTMLFAALLVVVVAFAIAACGGATSTATPRPSQAPSAAPSPLTGEVVKISAQSHRFDQRGVEAPADEAFHIEFANNELLSPHNVEIKDASGERVFMGKVFDGEKTMIYDVPALPAGTYQFRCTVHPEMFGTLVAG